MTDATCRAWSAKAEAEGSWWGNHPRAQRDMAQYRAQKLAEAAQCMRERRSGGCASAARGAQQ